MADVAGSDNIWSGHDLLAKDTALVFGWYLFCKLAVIRNVVKDGTKPDKRGWGSETYWAAATHQAITAVVWISLLVEHGVAGDLSSWAQNTWLADTALQGRERFIMLSNIAEVVTDCMVYQHYKGFGLSFWWHHVSTALCTAAFLVCKAPVGYTVSYGSSMEVGGLSLNAVSLFPSPFTFKLRAVMYSASRLCATFLLGLVTYEAYLGRMSFEWWAMTPAWALMAVNWMWISQIIASALKGGKKEQSKAKGA